MARKSKSPKSSKQSKTSAKNDAVEDDGVVVEANTESSSSETPSIIEDEATEVTPEEELSPQEEPAAPEEAAVDTEEVKAEDEPDNSDETESTEAADETETSDQENAPEEPTEDPESVVEEAVASSAPPEPQKSSPIPLFIGGAAAAGLGYLAAIFSQSPADTSALVESISANGVQLETLASDVASLQEAEPPAVDLSPIEDRLGMLSSQFEALAGDLASVRDDMSTTLEDFKTATDALSDRVTVLETAGPGESEAAQATEQDLAAFRAELQRIADEAEAQVAASMERASEIEQAAIANAAATEEAAKLAEQEAAEAAALAEREAAIATIMTALESGQGYGDALSVLGEVPEILSANAENGVTTVIELQQGYADAARTALSQDDTIPQDASAGDRLVAFFNQQTNARSLTPKEGDSTDAVLSRAEAMMKQGDVAAALAELAALGDAPKAAMQAWLDQATTRQAVVNAAAQLTTTN